MSELNIKYNPSDFTVIKKTGDKKKKDANTAPLLELLGTEPPGRTH